MATDIKAAIEQLGGVEKARGLIERIGDGARFRDAGRALHATRDLALAALDAYDHGDARLRELRDAIATREAWNQANFRDVVSPCKNKDILYGCTLANMDVISEIDRMLDSPPSTQDAVPFGNPCGYQTRHGDNVHGCQKPTGHEGPHETVTGLGVSCCGPTQDALPETSSMARDPSAIADLVVQDVAEIPYRTSPDDWPEAMIVTAEELHAFVVRRVRGADAAPEPVDAPSASAEERIAALRNRDAALRDFAESFTIDGDQIACVKCKRRCVASREDEPFVHASGCPKHSVGGRPWTVLTNILLSPVDMTSLVASAAEAERLRVEVTGMGRERDACCDDYQDASAMLDDLEQFIESRSRIVGREPMKGDAKATLAELFADYADLRAKLEAAENAAAAARSGRDDFKQRLAAAEKERDDLALQVAANEMDPEVPWNEETDARPQRLFHIQDGDRPMYVVAQDWSSALDAWWRVVLAENDYADDLEDPDGISMIAREDELLIDDPDSRLRKIERALGKEGR